MTYTARSKNALEKAILATVIALDIIFLVYWIILALNSRPHYDDLHFFWKLREMSIFDYVKEMYLTRSGRVVGYFINGIMSIIVNATGFQQLWAIVYYIIGIGICYYVAQESHLPVSRTERFAGVCLFYNLYILTNIDFPVFFWLCAMTYYLFFPVAMLALVYLNKRSLNWKEWIVLIISALFLGGANEAFTPIMLLLMLVCGLYWWQSQGWNIKRTWSLPQIRRIVWIATLLISLLVIVVIAPGNYARMSDTEQFVHPEGIVGWGRAILNAVVMFCYYMAFYIPYIFILYVLSYLIGTRLSIELPHKKSRCLLCIAVGFLVYLLFSCLPNVYLYGGFGIQRTYTHVVCALLMAVVLAGLVSGIGQDASVPGWLSLIGSTALTCIMIVNLVYDAPTSREYSNAVDHRVEYLRMLNERGQKETVTVTALPIPYTEDVKHFVLSYIGSASPMPVLYYISDTDVVPNEYEHHMKKVLGLNFDFVLEQGLD